MYRQLIAGEASRYCIFLKVLLSKRAVEFVQISRSEDLPPGALPFECDVIVSEWMGYCLLYECMAFTVLDARDL